MMPVVSASGKICPKFFVVKVNKLPCRTCLRNGYNCAKTPAHSLPSRTLIAFRSETESVDADNFMQWASIIKQCIEDLKSDNRKVLLGYDAYRAHLSTPLLPLFFENSDVVYTLPAHASGKLQPLDVMIFSSFSATLRNTTRAFQTLTESKHLVLFQFFMIISHAFKKMKLKLPLL